MGFAARRNRALIAPLEFEAVGIDRQVPVADEQVNREPVGAGGGGGGGGRLRGARIGGRAQEREQQQGQEGRTGTEETVPGMPRFSIASHHATLPAAARLCKPISRDNAKDGALRVGFP